MQKINIPSSHVFTAKSWSTIKGRGDVCSVNERWPDTLSVPEDYHNSIVLIDNTLYVVKGVETFKIGRPADNSYKLNFALLVKRPYGDAAGYNRDIDNK